MFDAGIQLTVHPFNALLGLYAHLGSIAEAERVLQRMGKRDIEPNQKSYEHLILVNARVGRVQNMRNILEKFLKETTIPPSESIFYTTLHACKETGDVEQAEEVFGRMKDFVQPTAAAYVYLIAVYGRAKRIQEMESVFERMVGFGIEPEIRVFNALMKHYVSAGKIDEARYMLRRVKQANLSPDEETLNCLAQTYLEEGSVADVEKIAFETFPLHNLQPNKSTYFFLLSLYVQEDQLHKAESVIKRMEEAEIKPDKYFFGVLMAGYSKMGGSVGAEAILSRMQTMHITLVTPMFNILMGIYLQEGKSKDANLCVSRIEHEGLRPDDR